MIVDTPTLFACKQFTIHSYHVKLTVTLCEFGTDGNDHYYAKNAKAASFAEDLSFGLPQDGDKSGTGKQPLIRRVPLLLQRWPLTAGTSLT